MAELQRIVEFTAAYDKRNPDPTKNYGAHGVNMRLVLKGPRGAVQFVLFTNWQLPHIAKEWENKPRSLTQPLPADVGYHSPEPLWEGQEVQAENCDYLDGKSCYYDGSGLAANDAFAVLVERGSAGIWGYLEDYYHRTFEDSPDDAARVPDGGR